MASMWIKRTNPRTYCEYARGFSFFYGEVIRFGLGYRPSYLSNHLHM